MDYNSKLGMAYRLKELRKNKGVTQRQLAAELGLSYASIVDYENGRREPNSKAMALLEQYYSVSGAYLRCENLEKDDEQETPSVEWEAQIEREPSLLFTRLNSIVSSSSFEDKRMIISILIEFRHVLSSSLANDKQRSICISLIENAINISSNYLDASLLSQANNPAEKERLEKFRRTCAARYSGALEDAQEKLIMSFER